jgi:hypothetical protein
MRSIERPLWEIVMKRIYLNKDQIQKQIETLNFSQKLIAETREKVLMRELAIRGPRKETKSVVRS